MDQHTTQLWGDDAAECVTQVAANELRAVSGSATRSGAR